MAAKFKDGLQTTIPCSACADAGRGTVYLIVRTNSHNGGQFLGCPNWPECTGHQSVPEEMKMRAEGQPEMFHGDA